MNVSIAPPMAPRAASDAYSRLLLAEDDLRKSRHGKPMWSFVGDGVDPAVRDWLVSFMPEHTVHADEIGRVEVRFFYDQEWLANDFRTMFGDCFVETSVC